MAILKIKTKGRVAFINQMEMTEGFKCDVQLDHLGIPSIPIGKLIYDQGIDLSGINLGLAYPEGYIGYIKSAYEVLKYHSDARSHIIEYFTEDIFYKDKGYHVRCIRPDFRYIAELKFDDDSVKTRFINDLKKISKVGYFDDGISGEVTFKIEQDEKVMSEVSLRDDIEYSSLNYSLTFLSPASFYNPFSQGEITHKSVPGALVANALGCEEETICSNAYISVGNTKTIPVPLCSAVVKYNETQHHFRLADGKDPSRAEQEITLSDVYTDDFENQIIRYLSPEITQITSGNGDILDVISAGQTFCGTIYGSDKEIRRCAEYVKSHPNLSLGYLSEEGLGEALITLDKVDGKRIPEENLERCFDVLCVSNTIIFNEQLMPSCTTEEFVKELEYKLGVTDKLKAVKRFTDICDDSGFDYLYGEAVSVTRCLRKGSVFRIETVDGSLIDISPIMHTFIGERNHEGYGEIRCFKSKNGFYRLAEKVSPKLYNINYPLTYKMLGLGAELTKSVMKEIFKKRVLRLAMIDRFEYKDSELTDDIIPVDVLEVMRNNYAPMIDIEQAKEWYIEYWRGAGENEAFN